MKKHSRYRIAKNILVFWCLFIGIGAVAGATGMLVQPDGSALGMDAMLPYFQVLPFAEILFQDFVFSGISLLIVNGLTNLTAAALIFSGKRAGIILGGVFGVTLMAWICIQFVIFPMNFMSTIYFVFGFVQAVTGYAAWVFDRQERFTVRREDYPHVGTNPRELVVFFSRMGYTKKVALEAAEKSGAEILELHTSEPIEGTRGFWWCGRYGMHRWSMPIEETGVDLAAYDKVTLCSPVWVFGLCAPMREFCRQAAGKLKRVDYILVHYMNASFPGIAREADRILGLQHEKLTDVCCHEGKLREGRSQYEN